MASGKSMPLAGAKGSPEAPTWPVSSTDYTDLQPIGHGVSSTVFSARCPKMGNEEVAIKIINLDGETKIDEYRKEIQTMVLSTHENLVKYHCSFVEGSDLYLVMQLLQKGSCLDILRCNYPHGIDDEALIASIIQQVLRALVYFHENEQIHRDVKAGNVLLDNEGKVHVADFGVARASKKQGEKALTFVGTPCWMAPEVLEQTEGYNTRADIWSLGITAMELAFGAPPYAEYEPMKIMVHILANEPPTLAKYEEARAKKLGTRPRKWKYLGSFLNECLRKKPAERGTAARLLEHKFITKLAKPKHIKDTLIPKVLVDKAGNPQTLSQRYAQLKGKGKQEAGKKGDADEAGASSKIQWDFGDNGDGDHVDKTQLEESSKSDDDDDEESSNFSVLSSGDGD